MKHAVRSGEVDGRYGISATGVLIIGPRLAAEESRTRQIAWPPRAHLVTHRKQQEAAWRRL
jgi:hypothetical protein